MDIFTDGTEAFIISPMIVAFELLVSFMVALATEG